MTCPDCKGTCRYVGLTSDVPCPACHGVGYTSPYSDEEAQRIQQRAMQAYYQSKKAQEKRRYDVMTAVDCACHIPQSYRQGGDPEHAQHSRYTTAARSIALAWTPGR